MPIDPRPNPVDPRQAPGDPRRTGGGSGRGVHGTQQGPPDPWDEPRRHRAKQPEEEPEGRSGSHGRRREPNREPEQARPARPAKSRHSATVSVLLMTTASLVAVGLLAVQANGQSPQANNAAQNINQPATPPATPAPSGSAAPTAVADPLALPAGSGSGERIVYSVAGKRVWLVGKDGATVQRTFEIVPGTIPVPVGTYHVSGRDSGETGSDGLSVQYVVFFDNAATVHSSTSFAFDAEADITGLPPAPTGHTGAVRTAQADAVAIWYFAPIGTSVVVV